MFLFKKHIERVKERMRLMAIPMGKTNFLHTRYTDETRQEFGFDFLQRVNTAHGQGTVLGQFSGSLFIWSDDDKPVFIASEHRIELKPIQEKEPAYTSRLTEIIHHLFNENIAILAKNMADFERFAEKIPSLFQEDNVALIAQAESHWDDWLQVAALTVEQLADSLQRFVVRHDQSFLQAEPSVRIDVANYTAIMQFTFNTLLEMKPDYADKTLMGFYYAMANQLAHYFYTQALNNPEKRNESDEGLSNEEEKIPHPVAALVCALMGANREPFIYKACYLWWIKRLFPDKASALMPHELNLDQWCMSNPDEVILLYRHLMKDRHFIACCDVLQQSGQPGVQFELAKWRYFYTQALFKTSPKSVLNRQENLKPLLQLVRNNWSEAAAFLIHELKGPLFTDSAPCFHWDEDIALALIHYYGRSPSYSDNQLAWSFWQKSKMMLSTHSSFFRDKSCVKTKLAILFDSGSVQNDAIQRLKADAEKGSLIALRYLREAAHRIPGAALACLAIFAGKPTLTPHQLEESVLFYQLAGEENAVQSARWYCTILKYQKKLTLEKLADWIEHDHEFAVAELELIIKKHLREGDFASIEKHMMPLLSRPKVLENLLPEIVILLIQYTDAGWRADFAEEAENEGARSSVFCNQWYLAFLERLKSMELANKKQLIPLLLLDTAALLTDESSVLLFQLVAREYPLPQLLAHANWLQAMASILVRQEAKSSWFKWQINVFLIDNPHVVRALAECPASSQGLQGCQVFMDVLHTLQPSFKEPHGNDMMSSSHSLH